MKKATDFLKYGRHVKSEGKPANYRGHMKALNKAKNGTSPSHMGKDCGYKCVFHNKGVKHVD